LAADTTNSKYLYRRDLVDAGKTAVN